MQRKSVGVYKQTKEYGTKTAAIVVLTKLANEQLKGVKIAKNI